jgi:hypothetical protein
LDSLHVTESHGQQALPGERHLGLSVTHIALLVLGFEFSPERLSWQASAGGPDKKVEIKKDKGQTRRSKGAYAGERSIVEDRKCTDYIDGIDRGSRVIFLEKDFVGRRLDENTRRISETPIGFQRTIRN